MSRLITHTIDEELAVLLIAAPSALSKTIVVEFYEKAGLRVEQIDLHQLAQQQRRLLAKDWYKVIFLLQNPLIESEVGGFEQLVKKAALKYSTHFVFPITTPVQGQKHSTHLLGWMSQVTLEHNLLGKLFNYIDKSRFIFYQDLIDKSVFPIKFLLANFHQGMLLNPQLELQLQDHTAVAATVVKELLKSTNEPLLISGHPRQSVVFLEKIKHIYRQYHERSLVIKNEPLILNERAMAELIGRAREVTTKQEVDELITPLVRSLPTVRENQVLPGIDLAEPERGLNKPQRPPRATLKPTFSPTLEPIFKPTLEPFSAPEVVLKAIKIPPNKPIKIEVRKSEDQQELKNHRDPEDHQEPEDHRELEVEELRQQLDSQEKILQHLLKKNYEKDALKLATAEPRQKPTLKPAKKLIEKPVEKTPEKTLKKTPERTLERTTQDEIGGVAQLVNNIFSHERKQQKKQHLVKLVEETKKGQRKLKNRKLLFVGGLSVGAIAMGVIVLTGIFLLKSFQAKNKLLAYLAAQDLPKTAQQKKVAELSNTASWIQNQLQLINDTLSVPVFPQALQVAKMSQYLAEFYRLNIELEKSTQQTYQLVMGQEQGDVEASLAEVNKNAEQMFKQLSALEAELKLFDTSQLNPTQKQQYEDYLTQLDQQRIALSRFQQLFPLLPELLGVNEKRVYAVLLQNNQELRPTGGFIQAVALLTFDQGQLINVQVEDVYDIDKQLTGVMAPPAEITQYLGEDRWFLRDANWHPDFPTTAEQVGWFLEKSLGTNVDGVMGINIKVMEELLAAIGQVDLPQYNEVITTRNLNERLEFHSEVQLVANEAAPDYSQVLLQTLISKLQSLSVEQVNPLLAAMLESANQKELLISMTDSNENASFNLVGWSGALVEPGCPAAFGNSACLVDAIAQVEANVGVNKANNYLERQIDHSIQLLPTQAQHKRVVTYKNKASSNAWPKGSYQALVRFYLPLNAQLDQITINDVIINQENIFKDQTTRRSIYGVLVETPIQQESKLELTYTVPHDHQTPFTYAFFDQKQPGAGDISPRVFLTHAPGLSPTLIAPQAEVQGEVIVFNPSSNNTGHMFVGATFE